MSRAHFSLFVPLIMAMPFVLAGFPAARTAAALHHKGGEGGGHVPRVHVTLPHVAAPSAAASGSFFADKTPPGQEIVRDDLGRPFVLPERRPTRIVSMAPNITEILFALGLGPEVVGVTRYCDYPPEALVVAKIGGLVDPNIEIIQSLRPGLVIAFRGNPLRIVERLRDLGLPVFVLDIGGGLDALYPLIAKIGLLTRKDSQAEALSTKLRARQQAVEQALGVVDRKPRVFVILRGQGLWTCGGESYLNDIIARSGAVNIAAAVPKKWVLYGRERIVHDNPDAVFILAKSESDFAGARAWLSGEARLGSLAAVAANRVYFLDENAASRFGPRLVDILDLVARTLHPERFGGRP